MSGLSCLVIMDYQVDIVSRYSADEFVIRTEAALRVARSVSMPVIFVQVGFRPGFPEVDPKNLAFSAAKRAGRFVLGDVGTQIEPRLSPGPNEVVVTKKRVGAFRATELEMVARSQGCAHLVLAGIATSGVVLSTVRDGADRDFAITVLSDCCTDIDPEVHSVLMEKVFPRQAHVCEVSEWIRSIRD